MRNQKKIPSIKKIVLIGNVVALTSSFSYADEGGASFWLPGQYGSLAAVPAEPGWLLPIIYYHSSVNK